MFLYKFPTEIESNNRKDEHNSKYSREAENEIWSVLSGNDGIHGDTINQSERFGDAFTKFVEQPYRVCYHHCGGYSAQEREMLAIVYARATDMERIC